MIRSLVAALLGSLLLALPVAARTPASSASANPPRSVAVTFDDLPYQGAQAELCDPVRAMALTEDFLAMLRPLDTRATAFVNEGKVCEALRADLLPRILNAWLDAGVDLGNHGFDHLNIGRITAEAYLADVDRGAVCTRQVLEARGRKLRYFRHPFLFTGETPEKKAALAEGLAARGYTIAPVTIDNSEWIYAALYRAAEKAGDVAGMASIGEAYLTHMAAVVAHYEPYSAELAGGREPAQVLLLHANSLNRDWYPKVHAMLLERGYRFVSLDEALADPVYRLPESWVRANGVSWIHRWRQAKGMPLRWEPDPPPEIMQAYKALN